MRSSASVLEEIKGAMSPKQCNVGCCDCEMDTWQQEGTKDCIKILIIDDLQKSRGLHSVSAYRHGLYIQVQACGCSAE